MEPLKPEEKAAILAARPQAAPEDIEEYERLLNARFQQDPSAPAALAAPLNVDIEQRLQELYEKLFG